MATLRQRLEWEVPEPYRALAINTTTSALDHELPDDLDALRSAFVWDSSPQGYEFWESVWNNETPKMPTT